MMVKKLELAGFSMLFLLFMDWLFLVTKDSVLSGLPLSARWLVFPASAFFPVVVVILFQLILLRGKLFALIPAFILSCSALLLIDNFTNTMFRFGIRSAHAAYQKVFYVVLFVVIYYLFFRRIAKTPMTSSRIGLAGSVVILLALLTANWFALSLSSTQTTLQYSFSKPSRRLNILLIGSDGLSAKRMSLYGYERKTTPFLDEFAKKGYIISRAIANSSDTHGSLTSILTGKLPTTTRVIYPPDLLRGKDSYQHLPGILQRMGYYTIQVAVRNYGDASDTNLRGGFLWSNFHSSWLDQFSHKILPWVGENQVLFLHQVMERLSERLLHIVGVKEMIDPYVQVTRPEEEERRYGGDRKRLEELMRRIRTAREPFFVHSHFLLTHGRTFVIHNPVFSRGKQQDQEWHPDFYDDAVLQFDSFMKEVVETLKGIDRLKNTLIVLYSDHGIRHSVKDSVPLVFWFPDGPAGVYPGTVENIDIAPTILDALGIPKPDWMEGKSILRTEPDRCRWVIGVRSVEGKIKRRTRRLEVLDPKPPFFTLGDIMLITCRDYYHLDLERRRLSTSLMEESVFCTGCESPVSGKARSILIRHLKSKGYDVSSFRSIEN